MYFQNIGKWIKEREKRKKEKQTDIVIADVYNLNRPCQTDEISTKCVFLFWFDTLLLQWLLIIPQEGLWLTTADIMNVWVGRGWGGGVG